MTGDAAKLQSAEDEAKLLESQLFVMNGRRQRYKLRLISQAGRATENPTQENYSALMTDRDAYFNLTNKLEDIIVHLLPKLHKENKASQVKKLEAVMDEIDSPDIDQAIANTDRARQRAQADQTRAQVATNPPPPGAPAGGGSQRVKAVPELEPAEKFSFTMDSKNFVKFKKEASNYLWRATAGSRRPRYRFSTSRSF